MLIQTLTGLILNLRHIFKVQHSEPRSLTDIQFRNLFSFSLLVFDVTDRADGFINENLYARTLAGSSPCDSCAYHI